MLDRLRGGLIVSIQPEPNSELNTPAFVGVIARCAQANGAAAVRIEGLERIERVRAEVAIPIVGLIKRLQAGFEPYITTSIEDVAAIAAAGADIVAVDATDRARPGGADVSALIEAAAASGALSMADCATYADGVAATAAGADVIATTLYGYTPATSGSRPPGIGLVAELAAIHPFALCEGGLDHPDQVRLAFAAGASAVCVGTAISNIDALVRRFSQAAPKRRNS
jgi:N-acylglucosamine-6-phosphate 2-epimerase